MISRKKKLYITQIFFLLAGVIILIYTYKSNEMPKSSLTLSDEKLLNINQQENQQKSSDVFFNIKYSGIDLAGNRYILKAKEAISKEESKEIIYMKSVNAIFYIKDGTELKINSENGIYNNKSLDMIFTKKVEANYGKNKLFSEKAEYSNSNNYFIISDNILVESEKGELYADELYFDLKNETLDISSFKDEKVNALIDLK